MGFYSEKIIPFFYDKSMDKPHMKEARKEILKSVSGDVLEIGFGTGLNLPHYPSSVNKLTIIDKNPGFKFERFRNYVMEEAPKTHDYIYEGIAVK